jgi:hypothetical protein
MEHQVETPSDGPRGWVRCLIARLSNWSFDLVKVGFLIIVVTVIVVTVIAMIPDASPHSVPRFVGYQTELTQVGESLVREGIEPTEITFRQLMTLWKKVAGDRPLLLEEGRINRPLPPDLVAQGLRGKLQQWRRNWDALADDEKRALRERTTIEATTRSGARVAFNLEQLTDKWPAVADGSLRLWRIRADRVKIPEQLGDLYQHATALSERVAISYEVKPFHLDTVRRILAALKEGRAKGQFTDGIRLEPMDRVDP